MDMTAPGSQGDRFQALLDQMLVFTDNPCAPSTASRHLDYLQACEAAAPLHLC